MSPIYASGIVSHQTWLRITEQYLMICFEGRQFKTFHRMHSH